MDALLSIIILCAQSGIAGSYDNSIFNLLKNCQTVFHSTNSLIFCSLYLLVCQMIICANGAEWDRMILEHRLASLLLLERTQTLFCPITLCKGKTTDPQSPKPFPMCPDVLFLCHQTPSSLLKFLDCFKIKKQGQACGLICSFPPRDLVR